MNVETPHTACMAPLPTTGYGMPPGEHRTLPRGMDGVARCDAPRMEGSDKCERHSNCCQAVWTSPLGPVHCNRKVHKDGLCVGHHQQQRRKDWDGKYTQLDPEYPNLTRLPTAWLRPEERKSVRVVLCEVEDCNRRSTGEGAYCQHHQGQHDRGEPFSPEPCRLSGCTDPAVLNGLCAVHYDEVLAA